MPDSGSSSYVHAMSWMAMFSLHLNIESTGLYIDIYDKEQSTLLSLRSRLGGLLGRPHEHAALAKNLASYSQSKSWRIKFFVQDTMAQTQTKVIIYTK